MSSDVKTRILDAAQRLIQLRGYQGFSFNDLKGEVGITTASMHYHYRTKAELGVSVLRRYRDQMRAGLNQIAQSSRSFPQQMSDIVKLFAALLEKKCICLGSAFGGEYGGLPAEVKTELRAFIEDVVNGFERMIQAAQKNEEVRGDLASTVLAQTLYGALQGALTAARVSNGSFLSETARTFVALCQPR